MKFVTLAVALLFALGCQAASLQADAPETLPNYLAHGRALAKMGGEQVKSTLLAVIERLNDEETKTMLRTKINEMAAQASAFQEGAAPVTDGIVGTLEDATRDLRMAIREDVAQLRQKLAPMQVELSEVVNKHFNEYRVMLEPILREYSELQEKQVAELKIKLEPVLAQLRVMVPVNMEETKTKLEPIVGAIREKATENLEGLRAMADPYVQEYKEQMKAVFSQAQSSNYENLREKMTPHLEKLRGDFDSLINDFRGMMAN